MAAMSIPEQQAVSWAVLHRMTGSSPNTVRIGDDEVRIVGDVIAEYEEDGQVGNSSE